MEEQIGYQLETDRNQGLKMLYALQRGGLLQLLSDDTKSLDNLSRPDKIYINNPTLMYALSPKIDTGTLRETFFCNQLSQSHEVRYPKAGDFLVDRKHLFEVGGKGKNFDQIKDIPNSYQNGWRDFAKKSVALQGKRQRLFFNAK